MAVDKVKEVLAASAAELSRARATRWAASCCCCCGGMFSCLEDLLYEEAAAAVATAGLPPIAVSHDELVDRLVLDRLSADVMIVYA